MYYQTLNPDDRTKKLISFFEQKISENMLSTTKKKRPSYRENDELTKELSQTISTRNKHQAREKTVLRVNDERRQNRNNSFWDNFLIGSSMAKPKHANPQKNPKEYGSLRVKSTPRNHTGNSTNTSSTSSASSSEAKPFSDIKIKIDENNDLEVIDKTPTNFERHHSVNKSIRKKRQKDKAQAEKQSSDVTVDKAVNNNVDKEEEANVQKDEVDSEKQSTAKAKRLSKSGSFSENILPLLKRSFSFKIFENDSAPTEKDLKNENINGNERKLSSSTFYVPCHEKQKNQAEEKLMREIMEKCKNLKDDQVLEIEAGVVYKIKSKKNKDAKKFETYRKSLIQECNDSIINEATEFIKTDDDVFTKIMDGQNVETDEELDFGIVTDEESFEIVEAINKEGHELRINVICMEQQEKLVSNMEEVSVMYCVEKSKEVEDILEDYLGNGTILIPKEDSNDIFNAICESEKEIFHVIHELNNNFQTTSEYRDSVCTKSSNEDFEVISPEKDKDMVEIRSKTNRTSYDNGIRETTIDDFGNIRIECLMPVDHLSPKKIQMTDRLKSIINELQETERSYIKGLRKVVREYMDYISKNCPTNALGMDSYLFGNISEIYLNQKPFYSQLKRAEKDVDVIVKIFQEHKKLFELYPPYFKSKKYSEKLMEQFKSVITARQEELGDKLSLNSYLLTPVQRLGKYILLFKEMKKELTKMSSDYSSVEDVINLLEMYMSQGNNELAIDSIKNHPYEITHFGAFLLRDEFEVALRRKWKATMTVFLFKKLVIFTRSDQKDDYIYEYGISIENLYICSDLSQKNIKLSNFLESKKDPKNMIIMESKIDGVLNKWYSTIKDLLWEQLNKIKEEHGTLTNKEKKLVRSKSTEESNSSVENFDLPSSTTRERKSTFYLENFI